MMEEAIYLLIYLLFLYAFLLQEKKKMKGKKIRDMESRNYLKSRGRKNRSIKNEIWLDMRTNILRAKQR